MAVDSSKLWLSHVGSDMIKVFVGKERKLYQLHKTLLCSVPPYFRRCLAGNFIEGQTGVLVLEDETVSAFDKLILWVYHHRLEAEDLAGQDGVNVYLLADMLCMEDFRNDIVDGIRSRYASSSRYASRSLAIAPIQYLIEYGPEGCQLVKYFIQQLAFNIVKNGCDSYLGQNSTDVHLAQAGANFLGLLFPALDKAHEEYRHRKLQDPAKLVGCHFHDHTAATWSCDMESRRVGECTWTSVPGWSGEGW